MEDPGASQSLDAETIDRVFREGSGQVVATLIRVFGDIDVAEDAVQDAFMSALTEWRKAGLPANPAAWIARVARNRAVDRLRRESLGRALLSDTVLGREPDEDWRADGPQSMDDQLSLIFTCCHPALAAEAQVALTLRLMGGLPTKVIADAFLVPETTMAQRLLRAKNKIKAAVIPYTVPSVEDLPSRLVPVLSVIYLIYNSGAGSAVGTSRDADALCREALRLCRLLRIALPVEQEVPGLLALMLLNESRRGVRFAADGSLILLRNQERRRWNWTQIHEAFGILRACIEVDHPSPYQVQASIQAVHASAESAAETDWPQIVALYDQLLALTRSPVVALNRAIAVGETKGPAAALALIDELPLSHYYLFHATRADLLDRLGRSVEAERAYRSAASLAPTEAERAFLHSRLGE